MADDSQEELNKLVFRIFSDQESDVYLLLEPGNRGVKVQESISNETIEQAQRRIQK